MDYAQLFERVKRYTGLWISRQTYAEAVAFVSGCDAGNNFGLLTGFQESLVVRLNGCDNLHWSALVLRVAFPTKPLLWAEPDRSKEDSRASIDALFDLLIEFLRERDQPDGLTKIFERYLAWLHKQSWYDPDPQAEPPKKRSSSKRATVRRSRQPPKKQKRS